MLDFINNKTALRWAVAGTFGLVIASATSIHNWQFYAILVLMWIMDRETFRQGVEQGICIGVKLPPGQRAKVEKIINEEKDSNE